MADIRDCVRSAAGTRARLRHPMLHGLEAESCREVAGMLETIPGVTGVSINPRVGSLLITWNEAETTAETLLETVEGYAAIFFAAGAEDEAGAAAPADEKETSCTACRAVESGGSRRERARQDRSPQASAPSARPPARSCPKRRGAIRKRAARILQNRTMLGAPCALDRRARRQADGAASLGGRRLHGASCPAPAAAPPRPLKYGHSPPPPRIAHAERLPPDQDPEDYPRRARHGTGCSPPWPP